MPGSFMSNSGCLFSSLAWIGIVISFISSGLIGIFAKNKPVMIVIRVLLYVMPVLAVLLILSDYYVLSDVRNDLSDDTRIGNSRLAPFKYLPEYEYRGYFKMGFPTTDEANHMVRRLRYTTAGMMAACIISLVLLAYRSIIPISNKDNKLPTWLTPSLIFSFAGLVVVFIHIITEFILKET